MSEQSLAKLQPLTPAEQRDLEAAESEIEKGLESFLSVGKSLLRIKEGRLYRKQAKTFAEYVESRWGFSVAKSYLLTQSVEVVANLKRFTTQPTSEHQVRPLATLEPEQQREVWKEACRLTGGEVPTFAQVNEIRKELFPESFKGRKKHDQDFETPEDWLQRGQELAREQRLSDWKIGDWFNYGEDKFGEAHKLIEEVIWNGPTTQELRRRAKVAQIVPVEKRDSLSFETAVKVVTINKPEILEQCESEQEILEAVASVRSAERVAKIRHEQAGTPAEHDEVRTELERMVPKIYQGLLNFFGESCERQVLDFLSEFIRFRFDSLKDKAR
jgi:hypothetical protein